MRIVSSTMTLNVEGIMPTDPVAPTRLMDALSHLIGTSTLRVVQVYFMDCPFTRNFRVDTLESLMADVAEFAYDMEVGT